MPAGTYIRTKEIRDKVGNANRGRKIVNRKSPPPFSQEHRMNLSKSNKGKQNRLGCKASEETRKKLSIAHTGKKLSLQHRKNLSEAKKGSNTNFWKGGVTSINQAIRTSFEYKEWRTSVFIRDNRTCIWCGSKKNIEADHIRPFAYFPELRFAIDNGRTLCRECHKKTDTYGNRAEKRERIKKEIINLLVKL